MSAANDVIFVPLDGIQDNLVTLGKKLGEQTINFYPDDEGYLVNYPGRTDYFVRGAEIGVQHGTPPTTDKVYSRIHIYRDGTGTEHIVFVANSELCVADGNGYRTLYTFTGRRINNVAWPHIFTHKDRLIVCNLGDPVLTWNGYEGIKPLGVTEIPAPPEIVVHEDPFLRRLANRLGTALPDPAYPDGVWNLPGAWPGAKVPENYLGNQTVDGTDIPGFYRWAVVFKDDDGNRGKPSALSSVIFVNHNEDDEYCQPNAQALKHWPLVQWNPPSDNNHIHTVEVYRSLNLHEDLGNNEASLYRDWVQTNTVGHRYTAGRRSDGDISLDTLLDWEIGPPKATDLGTSWGSRIVLRDPENQEVTYFSDAAQSGQFRLQTNRYVSRDKVEAYVPAGDRLLIITHTTCEVLYEDNSGNIRLLEIYENRGSYYGGTFASFRDRVFGFFNDGFYMFDGSEFTKVDTPYFFEPEFIDRYHQLQKAIVQGDWYYLVIRKDALAAGNNVLLKCHLPTGRWYIVEESVNDIAVSDGMIRGVDDSIYTLFYGDTYPGAKIHLRGITFQSIMKQRTISNVKLIADPQSFSTVTLQFTGDDDYTAITGTGITYPSQRKVLKDTKPSPYFGRPNTTWEQVLKWIGPNETILQLEMQESMSAYKHSIRLAFASGLPQRVRAIVLTYGDGDGDADSR